MTSTRGGIGRALLALVGSLGVAAAAFAGDGDVRAVRIEQPARFWAQSYTAMVPSIRLPTTHAGDDLIQVWMRLPTGGKVDVHYLHDQERFTLIFPPGTRSDRVEYFLVPDADGAEVWSPVDVRGTTIEADGSQRFHVLRPLDDRVGAALVGWSWPRDDELAQRAVDRKLRQLVKKVRRPPNKPPMDEAEARSMVEFNHCAECHQPNLQRARFASQRSLERATDAMGFFVPHAVVQDRCVVANHRPRDLNSEDPFVSVTCDEGPARLRNDVGHEYYVCPDDGVPMGARDVEAALRSGQEYTQRMCAARRYLYQHMTEQARDAFASAFRACGIP